MQKSYNSSVLEMVLCLFAKAHWILRSFFWGYMPSVKKTVSSYDKMYLFNLNKKINLVKQTYDTLSSFDWKLYLVCEKKVCEVGCVLIKINLVYGTVF